MGRAQCEGPFCITPAVRSPGELLYAQEIGSAVWQNYLYDGKGRPRERIRSLVNLLSGTQRLTVTRMLYFYDSLGRLIQADDRHFPGDSLVLRVLYTYDSLDNPAIISHYNDSGRVMALREIHTYDRSGKRRCEVRACSNDADRLCCISSYDSRGHLLERRQYCDTWTLEYIMRDIHSFFINDSLGNPTLCMRTYSGGNADTLRYSYTYDHHGNWIERRRTGRETYVLHGRETRWYGLKSVMKRRIEYFDENKE